MYLEEVFPKIDKIDMIVVSFVKHKRYFLIYKWTDTLDTYYFERDDNDKWFLKDTPGREEIHKMLGDIIMGDTYRNLN